MIRYKTIIQRSKRITNMKMTDTNTKEKKRITLIERKIIIIIIIIIEQK